jgi:hypothetical protein
MYGLQPRSPDDLLGLFALTQLHGYPVVFSYDDLRDTPRPLRQPKRRFRSLALATRRRLVPRPAPSS